MTALPKIVHRDGVDLAYQATGEGGPPLLFVNGWFTDIVAQWRSPRMVAFLQRLGAFATVISVDKRGMGRSSRVPIEDLPDLGTRVQDLRAVLDALDVERIGVLGTSESGPLAVAFTAAYPERVERLILDATRAKYGAPVPGYPFGYGDDELEPYVREYEEGWGTPAFAADFYGWVAPTLAAEPAELEAFVELMRASGDAATVGAMARLVYATTDARALLPSVACPALVLGRRGDQVTPLDEVRWLAEHLPDATLEVLDGVDHPAWGAQADAIADRIEAFIR
jgi:pimeloyl-ACP methyl ester carboxylesterase